MVRHGQTNGGYGTKKFLAFISVHSRRVGVLHKVLKYEGGKGDLISHGATNECNSFPPPDHKLASFVTTIFDTSPSFCVVQGSFI